MGRSDYGRRLLWHGLFLFLLGLLTGLVVPMFQNPRMGLSAHLEGVMNGIFLAVSSDLYGSGWSFPSGRALHCSGLPFMGRTSTG